MSKIKVSVNDANGVAAKNSERVEQIIEFLGAKPAGAWKKGMDSGRGISTAYYAESLEREYEYDGDLYDLKALLKGAQFVRATPDIKIDEFSGLEMGGARYFKLCDIDLWVPTKLLFIPSWEKLRSTVAAKKMRVDEEEFARGGLKKFEDVMKKAPAEIKKAVKAAEDELLSLHRS